MVQKKLDNAQRKPDITSLECSCKKLVGLLSLLLEYVCLKLDLFS